MRRVLDELYLKSLRPDPDKRIEISDTKCPGLRFRLTSNGRATWMFEKRVKDGPKRKHTLGVWPAALGLSDARKVAREIAVGADKGIDRIAEREAAKARAAEEAAKLVTVATAIDRYTELHLNSIKTGDERRRQLLKSLDGHLESSVANLSRLDLQSAVDRKAGSGARAYANRIRAALVAFANWCYTRGYIDEPIGAGIAKATREQSRDRVLSVGEIRAIWAASYQMGEVWGPYFRIVLLTGQRRGEISQLRWTEVDSEGRRIVKPGRRTKNSRPHQTHLSVPALFELAELRERSGQGIWVFSFDGERPVANPSHAKSRLDKILGADCESWRIHDIRTAMATALAQAGEAENVVDRILNHAASGSAPSAVARVYNQAELLPQRAAALDRWAELVTGEATKVVHLGGTA